MRRLKVLFFQVKLLYSKWYLALLAASAASGIPFRFGHEVIPGEEFIGLTLVAAAMLVTIVFFGNAPLAKSDVDFVLTTPANMAEVLAMRAAVNSITYLVPLAIYTFKPSPWYAVSLASLPTSFSLLGISAVRRKGWIPTAAALALMAVGLIAPPLSPLYGLYEPSPIYAAYDAVLLAAAAIAALRAFAIGEVDLETFAEQRINGAGLPKSRWGVVWRTSIYVSAIGAVRVGRINALAILAPVSIGSALAFYLSTKGAGLAYLIANNGLVFYLLYFLLHSGLMSTISRERLWLSLAVDPSEYFRYRTAARTLLSLIAVAPWAAAFAAESAQFPPAKHLAIASISAALAAPVFSSATAALAEVPQVRELGLSGALYRFAPKTLVAGAIMFVLAGAYLTPYALASAVVLTHIRLDPLAPSLLLLTASAAINVLASFKGRRLWAWLVEKLIENGYV